MIEIQNLSVSYGKKAVLKDVNLSVEKGKITAVIGPNGSGKSTLLHVLSRLISHQEGQIIIEKKNVSDYTKKDLAQKIALLPQLMDVPDMSVSSFVLNGRYPYTFNGRYSDDDRLYAKRAMEMTDVLHLADRNLKTLSGGERQRAYLALCLAQGADVLLLDEPTTFLDIKYQFEILKLIKSLKDKTVVIVLHDISHALTYSDNIVVMQNGTVRFCGTPTETANSKIIEEVFGISLVKDSFMPFSV